LKFKDSLTIHETFFGNNPNLANENLIRKKQKTVDTQKQDTDSAWTSHRNSIRGPSQFLVLRPCGQNPSRTEPTSPYSAGRKMRPNWIRVKKIFHLGEIKG
jgi:hypothetical protein